MFRPTKIKHYLSFMSRQGYSADNVLYGTGIDAAQLDNDTSLININQFQRVVSNMIALTGNNSLGFDVGQEVDANYLGIAGYALMCNKNLLDVYKTWDAFAHLLVGIPLRLALEQESLPWRVTFTERLPLGELKKFCLEEAIVAGHLLSSKVIGKEIEYSSVEFAFPEPANVEKYRALFNCNVVFDASVSAVNVIAPRLSDSRLNERDMEFFHLCQGYCDKVMMEISEGRPLSLKIRQIFLNSAANLPNQDNVASLLHMSERTLKRRLRDEGVSFNTLLREFRFGLVQEYLNTSSSLSVEQIAGLTGYCDGKSLSRAFKCWSGVTITQYRAAQNLRAVVV